MQEAFYYLDKAAPAIFLLLWITFAFLWLIESTKRKLAEKVNEDNLKKAKADKKELVGEIERLKGVVASKDRELVVAERLLIKWRETQERVIEKAHQCRLRRFNNIPINISFSSTFAIKA